MTLNKNKTRASLSLILKTIIIFSAFYGIGRSMFKKVNGVARGMKTLLFFTNQSNIWIALVLIYGVYLIIRNKSMTRIYSLLSFVFTVSITLTGIVFCFVLAPTSTTNPWNLSSVLNHVVVPLLSVIDFMIYGPFGEYKSKDSLYVTIPPIYYCIFASLGYILDWEFQTPHKNYPYFFLNWGTPLKGFGFSKESPFMGVVWWIIVLALFLIVVAVIYLAIVKRIGKKIKE